jgi:uncharacterized Fe-S cluster-containing radical SAM superfamily enzyme
MPKGAKIVEQRKIRINVSIDAVDQAKLKELGGGNVSKGIRRLLEAFKSESSTRLAGDTKQGAERK